MGIYYLVWFLSLVAIIAFRFQYWSKSAKWSSVLKMFYNVASSQLYRSKGLGLKGLVQVVNSIFLLLVILNLMGLVPYVFSVRSHLVTSFLIALPMWLSFIVSGMFYNLRSVIASLLPMGAPAGLNPFLVIIETVRISVRPITLSVRLTANIRAGHIVLTLIGCYMVGRIFMSKGYLVLSAMIQVFYTIFEFGICLIQAYIFCLLVRLYADEHPID